MNTLYQLHYQVKRIAFFFYTLGFCTALVACKPAPSSDAAPAAPNILFIFADDMTYSAIHALGNTEVQTPHLDKLVKKGTTFTHAYNMGAWSGAVCMASRAMIISGRSVWNAHQRDKEWGQAQHIEKTWGTLLGNQGYSTYMSGKWHVKIPADTVFDSVRHVRPGMPYSTWDHGKMVQVFKDIAGGDTPIQEVMPLGYHRPVNEMDTAWSPADPRHGGYWEGGRHWSEVLRDDALGFIEMSKSGKQPFFMYLAFNAPHDPRQSPQAYLDLYPLSDISLPESWLPEYPYKDSIGNGYDLRDEALAPFPRTPYAIKKNIQEYYALITHLDHQIGMIMDKLEESGKLENTYILFTADHGLAMGRHGLMGKQSLFDHSIRAPFIIMGPEIPQNKKVAADIYIQDAMATSLELAGVAKPDYVEFNSVLKLAKDEKAESPYEAIYGAYINYQRMIRKDGYKLLVFPKLNKVLLFDMENDPEEMNNLADDNQHKETVRTLFRELIVLQAAMNDPLDLKPLQQKLHL